MVLAVRAPLLCLLAAVSLLDSPSTGAAQEEAIPPFLEAAPFERDFVPEGVEDLRVAGTWRAWTMRKALNPRSRAPSYEFAVVRHSTQDHEITTLGAVFLPRGGRQGSTRIALGDDGTVAWFDANDWAWVRVDAEGLEQRIPLAPVCEREWVLDVQLDSVMVQRVEDGRVRIDEHSLGENGFLPARRIEEWDGSDVHHAVEMWFVRDVDWCALGGPGIEGLRFWRAHDAGAEIQRTGSGFLRPTFVGGGAILAIEESSPWLERGFGSVAIVLPRLGRSVSCPVPFRPTCFTPEGVFGPGMVLDPLGSGIRPAYVRLVERREVVARWREGTSTTLVFGPGRHSPRDVLRLDLPDPRPLRELPGPQFPDARPVEIEVARAVDRFERLGPPSAEDLRGSGLVLLHHEDSNVRHRAGLYLAGRYGSAARPWIRAALKADPNGWPDLTLVRCLVMCGGPKDGDFLLTLLETKKVEDRDWDAILDALVLLHADDPDSWLRLHTNLLSSQLERVAAAKAEHEIFWATWAELVAATRGS